MVPENIFQAGKALLIAHHVQEVSFSTPSRPRHKKGRENAAENIIDLCKAFHDLDLSINATVLVDKMDWKTNEEAGLHPEIPLLAQNTIHGHESSAVHYLGGLKRFTNIVLTGYNAPFCILDSAKDIRRTFKEANLIIPTDAIDETYAPTSPQKSKESAIREMRDLGCIITNTDAVKKAVFLLARKTEPM